VSIFGLIEVDELQNSWSLACVLTTVYFAYMGSSF